MEEWKIIEEFPDYAVSNLGRIKRIRDGNTQSRVKAGKILKLNYKKNGYVYICLCRDNKKYYRRVHRLVLEVFKPICNIRNLQCNHKDGDKSNNKLDNLEWMTAKENQRHAFEKGLRIDYGENNNFSKLIEENVIEIKKLLKNNVSGIKISKLYNVSTSAISAIKTGRNWKHIKEIK